MTTDPPSPKKASSKPWGLIIAFTLTCGGAGIVAYTHDESLARQAQQAREAAAAPVDNVFGGHLRDEQMNIARSVFDQYDDLARRMRDFNVSSCEHNTADGVFEHFALDPATGKPANSLVPAHFKSQKACVAAADDEYEGAHAQAFSQYMTESEKIMGAKPDAKPAVKPSTPK